MANQSIVFKNNKERANRATGDAVESVGKMFDRLDDHFVGHIKFKTEKYGVTVEINVEVDTP